MRMYGARFTGNYDIQKDEDWAVPILWTEDGRMSVGQPLYGVKELEGLKDFPIDLFDLACKYIREHPELISEEFFVEERGKAVDQETPVVVN